MLPDWYNDYKVLIEDSITRFLNEYFDSEKNPWLNIIKDASLYAVQWWKKIRSVLAMEFYLLFTWKKISNINYGDDIIKFCIALECMHGYSLVHDDLPCMDNDEFRRWNQTTWKKFWETNAVLVWDLLNSLSFEILSDIPNPTLINLFWKAVWLNWMLWWQVLDLYYENNPDKLTLENLIEVHNKKTWALIEVSVLGWLLIAEQDSNFVKDYESNNIKKYLKFWKKLWLAFQLKDDILDVEWTFEETWKSVWWEKKWFVFFEWLDKTKEKLDLELNNCLEIIGPLNSDKLEFIIEYIWKRKK